jgi:hypothetical protein
MSINVIADCKIYRHTLIILSSFPSAKFGPFEIKTIVNTHYLVIKQGSK